MSIDGIDICVKRSENDIRILLLIIGEVFRKLKEDVENDYGDCEREMEILFLLYRYNISAMIVTQWKLSRSP